MDKRETQSRIFITVLCIMGISAVGYGMIQDSDEVFVFGIACVIAGYLIIRRNLKESLQKKADRS